MEEWNPFLILWLWQPEGSWDSKVTEEGARPFCSQPLPPSDREEGTECSYLLSSDRGAWAGGQKDSCSYSHWTLTCSFMRSLAFRLCLHGPSDSSRNSGCETEFWRHGFQSSHTVPLLTLCFVQLTLGALTCWRIGHFKGGGNHWSR